MRSFKNIIPKLKERAKQLKKESTVIYLALTDRRTPLSAKLFAILTLLYLLSPIDLIPDFIPVLGLLDDLLIVPVLILITLKLIPPPLLEEIRKNSQAVRLRKKWYFALPVLLIYLLAIYFIWQYF